MTKDVYSEAAGCTRYSDIRQDKTRQFIQHHRALRVDSLVANLVE